MQIPILQGDSLDFSDGEAYQAINNYFVTTRTPLIVFNDQTYMLKHYRDYKRDGMSAAWIVNELYNKRFQIAPGASYDKAQAAAFVNALTLLQKGQVSNPYEKPTWGEILGEKDWTGKALLITGLAFAGFIAFGKFFEGVGRGVTSKVTRDRR